MLFQIRHFLLHILQARSLHLIHSPFVYDFCTKVLWTKKQKSEIGGNIESLRKNLLQNETEITLTDFGAGFQGKEILTKRIKIADIAKSSARRRHEGELLYRICKHYQPKKCLEFGTNLGISTLYQLAGLEDSMFISLEGDESLAKIAMQNIQSFDKDKNIEILTGEFSETLAKNTTLHNYEPDYIFIDGNHRYAPTMSYFHYFLPKIKDGGIIIFDDIYWSEGMLQAWKEIIAHKEVSVSIDLFWFGICFIRRNQAKEAFKFLSKG